MPDKQCYFLSYETDTSQKGFRVFEDIPDPVKVAQKWLEILENELQAKVIFLQFNIILSR